MSDMLVRSLYKLQATDVINNQSLQSAILPEEVQIIEKIPRKLQLLLASPAIYL